MKSIVVFVIGLMLLAADYAPAQIILTANTTISDSDTSLDNQDVIVRGCTLTINGVHPLASLRIQRNLANQPGVVTHDVAFTNATVKGLHLQVAGNLWIEGAEAALVASRIDVNGRGYPAGQGPGAGHAGITQGFPTGGGHGGAGAGRTEVGVYTGGHCYGSLTWPADFGSGSGLTSVMTGSAGGGAVRLDIGGYLSLDGTITANGASMPFIGGAGGSVWITAGEMRGAGSILANGGNGFTYAGGTGTGAGGGRIGIHRSTSTFTGIAEAKGGAGYGGAGTVYVRTGKGRGLLSVINNNVAGAEFAEMTGDAILDMDVLVAAGGAIGPARADPSLRLTVLGNVTISPGGMIGAPGHGFPEAQGPGAGARGNLNPMCPAGGGGYGGAGGDGNSVSVDILAIGGSTYGSIAEPIDMGSGGGAAGSSNSVSGSGGGAFFLSVAGSLTVNGAISSDGVKPTIDNGTGLACGSGGSVWVECESLHGAGSISALGGSSNGSTAGGGGRIALYYDQSDFSGSVSSKGGRCIGSSQYSPSGGAGTIYLKRAGERPTLRVDNGGPVGNFTEMTGNVTLDANLVVSGGAQVGPPREDPSLHLTVLGDVLIDPTASISADNRGFRPGFGPGSVGEPYNQSHGGGYGGAGGGGCAQCTGGRTYGSIERPADMGSGGHVSSPTNLPARAGGAVRLSVLGTLTVDGGVSSNSTYARACSGGSVWIDCDILAGTGSLAANAANGSFAGAGGGGGGRVAVYCNHRTFSGAMTAFGGPGSVGRAPGGAGTIFVQVADQHPTLLIDNNNRTNGYTEFSGVTTIDADVTLSRGALVGPRHGDDTLHLNVLGDMNVQKSAAVAAVGRGYPGGEGPGAGASQVPGELCDNGSAGHGGRGGASSCREGGISYDFITYPSLMGSSGGAAGSTPSFQTGGRGGGLLRISVRDTLNVDGAVSANGFDATNSVTTSAGSGGSILLHCATLSGSGSVSAHGANYTYTRSQGGGGGGRIAIYTCQQLLPLANISAIGGTPGPNGQPGEPGTIYFGGNSVTITQQPQASDFYVSGATLSLSVAATTTDEPPSLSYQWRRISGNSIVDLHDGDFGGAVSGAQTPTLTVAPLDCSDAGQFDCLVSDSCAGVPSTAVSIVVFARADLDRDGFINSQDFFNFLTAFFQILPIADFNMDGFINSQDFFDFLGAFFAGCL